MEEGWSLSRGIAWGCQKKGICRSNGIRSLEMKSHGSCTWHSLKFAVVDLVSVPVTGSKQGMDNICW
jgi:hypothetical protein